MALELMYITNNPDIALAAEKAGVDRIWIDLETLGKEERQGHIDSVKSHHSIDDIRKIAPFLNTSKMQVRVNPWNENSVEEINSVIAAGAQYIMLPMWKTTEEVSNFIKTVNGRAITILLLETKEAEEILDDVLKIDGIDEMHIGLNDLHLSYHMKFMFELLTNGTVEKIVNKIKAKGLPYGFGGFSHLGDGMIPAEKIIMEHYRLGSTRSILSRGFCNTNNSLEIVQKEFIDNMRAIRDFEKQISHLSKDDFEKNREKLCSLVDEIVRNKQ